MRRASDVRGPKSGGISSKFRVSSYEKNQRIRGKFRVKAGSVKGGNRLRQDQTWCSELSSGA